MIYTEMNFYSKALTQTVTVNVLLPEKKKTEDGVGVVDGTYKTLWLLHGLSKDHTAWLRRSNIERFAEDYGIAVVLPEVGRYWYTDTSNGEKYFTFITEELPTMCRGCFKGMSDKREDNLIAGNSMGGYGAVKAALHHPDKYFGCVSLSGALDVTRKNRVCNLPEWRAIFGFDLQDPMELEGSFHDLFAEVRRKAEAGVELPKMYLWCGTEDTLIKINRDYHALLTELGVEHTYEESEGDHSWHWWDMHIQSGLRNLLG